MALKPIDPGSSAPLPERKAFQSAQEQAKREPHLWANGPEHRMSASDPADGRPGGAHGGAAPPK